MIEKHLSIGGMSVLLRAAEARFWDVADQRYANFYTPPAPAAPTDEVIEVSVVDGTDARGDGTTTIDSDTDAGIIRMTRVNSHAEWNRTRRRSRVWQPAADFSSAPRPDYAVDSLLRVILSYRLRERGGLLIHAAGVMRGGAGYLFVGKSGAGKTTTARLSAPTSTILSDDLTILFVGAEGAEVFGSPFFGEFATSGVNRGAPLAGIYFLEQAPATAVLPIPRRDAVTRLLQSLMIFDPDGAGVTGALRLVADVCERVPCRRLRFVPDPSFWRAIEHDRSSTAEQADRVHGGGR